ncbi:MAG TPA: protein kinase [Trebonia sp.]|jgi:predicted Ser/Thr protein kinase|nr:protein kinase [Trebonia sp.]
MPALESLPGKIGPYRIVEKLGEGGMGVVYLATGTGEYRAADRRQVALKMLGPTVAGEPSARARLSREVATMRRVHSPYVAEILDADLTGASPYIVTQYVPGRTLEAAVKRDGPLRGAALHRFAYGLAEALAAIHAAGVVHRDLKPGNVMVLASGDPVVIDFGIANVADGTKLTQTGIVMGTPGYLSPEVIEGEPSSPASDIHSWGATVAFAATGRQPFGVGTFQSIFFRVLNGQVELDGVPGSVMPLLTAALTRSPRHRPSAQWLAAQCAALTAGGGAAAPTAAQQLGPGGTLVGPPPGLPDTPTVPPRPSGSVPYGNGPGYEGPVNGGAVNGAPPGGRARVASRAPVDEEWAEKLRAYRARDAAANAGPRPAADVIPGQAGGAGHDRDSGPGRDSASPRPAPGREPSRADSPARSRPTSGHGMISLAIGVIAVAMAVALPVAGTLLALVVVTLLRAADRAESSLAVRRSAYGARASDILVVIVTAPWKVAGALLATLAFAPLALAVAAAAAMVSVIAGHTTSLPDAGSWAAGAAVAWIIVGPGSARPRRQLRRITGGMIRSSGVMVVVVVVAWCLALAAVSSALSTSPYLWPANTWALPHLPSLGSSLHAVQQYLLDHAASAVHLP